MTTRALSAKDIVKRVSDGRTRREILRGINLDLARGELVLVRGASGSGKTTLLAILGGMLLPTSGEVWLGGEAISRLRDHQRAEVRRARVGYLFQDFGLIEGMTALENALLPLVPDGRTHGTAVARAQTLFERMGIGALLGSKVSSLSGGERQRVALVRAWMTKPDVVLLDEPTAHLDAERARDLMTELLALRQEGAALLIASHDPRIVDDARIDRRFELSRGTLT